MVFLRQELLKQMALKVGNLMTVHFKSKDTHISGAMWRTSPCMYRCHRKVLAKKTRI